MIRNLIRYCTYTAASLAITLLLVTGIYLSVPVNKDSTIPKSMEGKIVNYAYPDDLSGIKDILDGIKDRLGKIEDDLKKPKDNPIDIESLLMANVLIQNRTQSWGGSGTHIVYKGKHYILSCGHLIDKETDLLMVKVDDKHCLSLRLIKVDHNADISLFEIGYTDFPYVELNTKELKVGDTIYIIGNPGLLEDIVTKGMISSITSEYVLSDAISYHGNSGGGVFKDNKLVGILIAGMHYEQKEAYGGTSSFSLSVFVKMVDIINFLKNI